ncbi:S8 family peptidase [Staphylococcus argenteus]|uniref:S8 family peptidase n=1 Tax=Staphylococcus argenteus TaxID=985002 RepID=UPI0009231EAE|nr:S8 family serine peptidase [Staphylococcus argenteus]MDR7650771.1 S8 family serine peptidase [Staphylococcus argenteus]MDR7683467.1 S8 family serine peptidase [Staphylococcus argenteus]SGX25356.1 epidermin leader peptide processing serine protease EpiP [Staphylococcus argenteus]SGX63833.1 epidermin leader peptide processing serine protease EpiP [Staphylococcus argenteus]SHD35836.1 epidermin leader peptide processing serine protease EpiP [Staphylococcus argenteus]
MKTIKRVLINLIILSLLISITMSTAIASEEQYYSVEYKNTAIFSKLVKKNSLNVVYNIPELHVAQIKMTKTHAKALANYKNDIKYINATCSTCMTSEKTIDRTSNESLFSRQWDMNKITNNGASYDDLPKNANTKIAIIDTGVMQTHDDLKNNFSMDSKNLVPLNGFRGTEPEETGDVHDVNDRKGHGTMVSGQISANGRLIGVAPNNKFTMYRVFGSKKTELLWISKAIVQAANDGNQVINISVGSYTILDKNEHQTFRRDEKVEYDALQKAINYAKKKKSIVVAAAGNDGIDVSDKQKLNIQREYQGNGEVKDVPASMDNVVTVGSTDQNSNLSEFSNFGMNYTDIVAPGGSFAYFNQFGMDKWMNEGYMHKENILTTANNGRYIYQAGTSLATPKVSGALALIIDKYHLEKHPDKAIELLYQHGTSKNNMPFSRYGHGELDVYKALNVANQKAS